MESTLNEMIQAGRLAYDIGRELAKLVKAIIEANHPDAQVEYQEVEKNNGTEKPAIQAGNDSVKANYYIEDSVERIQSGESSLEEEAQRIADELEPHFEKLDQVQELTKELTERPDYSRITLEVVNKELNAEMLKKVPHRDVGGDLTLIPRYMIDESASCIINEGICGAMGLTSKELLDIGEKNVRAESYSVVNMAEKLADCMGISHEDAENMFPSENKMLVISNQSGRWGATGIFMNPDLRKEVAGKIGDNFYIIPSSIHETIAVSADTMSPDQAKKMIEDVNRNELKSDEVLSNHPYHVDAQTLKISNPCEKQEMVETTHAIRHAAAHH